MPFDFEQAEQKKTDVNDILTTDVCLESQTKIFKLIKV